MCTTPNGPKGEGGVWESGGKIASDAQGNLYVTTANGEFDETLNAGGFPANGDYGDSVLKISPDPSSSPETPNINGWGLKVADYFTPSNEAELDALDLDVSAAGPVLLPDSMGLARTRT